MRLPWSSLWPALSSVAWALSVDLGKLTEADQSLHQEPDPLPGVGQAGPVLGCWRLQCAKPTKDGFKA